MLRCFITKLPKEEIVRTLTLVYMLTIFFPFNVWPLSLL